MLSNVRSLALLTILILPSLARGQAPSTIIDGAEMFSEAAIREAKAELARLDRAHGVTLTVETVDSLRGQGVDEFAVRRAEQLGHKGIFVLIARKDRKVDVLASPRTLREELGVSRLNAIRDAFTDPFGKGQVDAGLIKGVQAASTALTSTRPSRRSDGFFEVPSASTSTVGSSAGSSPLVLRQQVRLTLAGARKAIAGAEARATEKGYKMNIAAVDEGGHLLAFARMDGARPASVATASAKALTAATYRTPTGPLSTSGKEPDVLTSLSLQNASGGKLTTLLGGIPIVVDGQVIGALGVGGGTGEQDAEVARAGVDAFLAGLQEPVKEKEVFQDKEKEKDAEGKPRITEGEASPK